MKLIPQPQQIAPLPGQYRITYRDRITLDAGCSPAAYTYAKLLAGELEKSTGLSLLIDRRTARSHPGIHLRQSPELEQSLGKESYEIGITPKAWKSPAAGMQGCCTACKRCGKSYGKKAPACPVFPSRIIRHCPCGAVL